MVAAQTPARCLNQNLRSSMMKDTFRFFSAIVASHRTPISGRPFMPLRNFFVGLVRVWYTL
jgi:hypothetical protein